MADVHLDSEALRPGTTLGPYELVLPVGIGGMARVWVARVRATGQLVALKMLLSHLAENASFRQMFFDEARIASRVKHPNVCATYELVELGGILTLVMEWVDGGALDRMLRPGPEGAEEAPRAPLPPRHAARIIADACAGLHAAHDLLGDDGRSLDVVHRDVSPHNILLTADGQVKVTDFGVAKALGKSHMTLAGQVKGKLAYMSPEHLMGSGVDRRSDVFALGCVLYEITTGQRPFQGEHDPQVMAAIVMGNYDPPSAVMPSYPRELEAIVLRAIANEPGERFPTAENMRRALEEYIASSGPPLGAREVANLLADRCGATIAARAQALSAGRAPPPVRLEPGGSGAMEIDRRPLRSSSSAPFIAVAALLGALVGAGVLLYVRGVVKRSRVAAATTATLASDAPALDAGAGAAPDAARTVDVGDLDDAPPDAGLPLATRVRLRLPAGATLVVDGAPLPAGADSVERPIDGGTLSVLVRAERFEDTLLLVDATTPDEVEVTLVPKVHAHKPQPKPKPTEDEDDTTTTPPNPYE